MSKLSDSNRFSVPVSRSSYYVVDIGLELYYASYDTGICFLAGLRIRITLMRIWIGSIRRIRI